MDNIEDEEDDRLTKEKAATSPSHEFSFTISLHPSPNCNPTTICRYSSSSSSSKNINNPTFAIDLAPADDIFFHGHLLPLHLLSSSASISPRPSDFSIENLSLPLGSSDGSQSQKYEKFNSSSRMLVNEANEANETKEKLRPKTNSSSSSYSSLFGLGKWLLKASGGGGGGEGEKHESENRKKKMKKMLDLGRVLKRYMSAVEPLFAFRSGDKEKRRLAPPPPPPRPYSFSSNISVKDKEAWRRRRGELSAPASMRTSPTNSGLLVATSSVFSTSDESTMEELQNAIQAAISHCKNSIAVSEEDKCTC